MGISFQRLSKYKDFYLWLKQTRRESSCRSVVDILENLLRDSSTPYPTYDYVQEYILKRQLEGRRGKYLNKFIVYTKVYTRYLKEKSLPCDIKCLELRELKEEAVNKATLSDEEIEAFLTLPNEAWQRHGKTKKLMKRKQGPGYEVWTLWFSIMAYSGMRPTEISHLTVNDVDFGRNVFVIRETKTHDTRLVPIAEPLLEPLKEHLKTCENYLFPSRRGGNNGGFGAVFDSVDWGYNFHTRIKRLGIKRTNLTVYSLRHSFITRLLSEDINIYKVQKIVGHRQLSTTLSYTHLTTKDIQKAILKDPLFTRSNPQGKLGYIKDILTGLLLDNQSSLSLSLKDTPTSVKFEASIKDERT